MEDFIILIFLFVLSIAYYVYIRNGTTSPITYDKLFYTTDDYTEMKLVEDSWKTIQNEIPEFDKDKEYPMRDKEAWNNKKGDSFIESLKNNKSWVKGWWDDVEWYQFPLIYHNKVIGDAANICPETIKILQQIPSIQIAGYALLLPKTKMPVHTDATGKKYNSMAVNMGLKSYDSKLYVKDSADVFQERKHSNGNLIIFDSTNEHYAENLDEDNIRVILYMDFKTNTIFADQMAIPMEGNRLTIKMHKILEAGTYLAKYQYNHVLIYADGTDIARCIFKEPLKDTKIYLKNLIFLNEKVRESIENSF